MTAYDAMPWLAQYPPGEDPGLHPAHPDGLSLFRAAVARAPDAPALHYFDATLAWGELDRLSDGLAAVLREHGFAAEDRLACCLQSVPHFPVAMLAAWKAGGILVPVNPMYRERELALIVADCTPRALLCHPEFADEVMARLDLGLRPKLVLTASAFDFQTRDDPRAFPGLRRCTDGRDTLAAIARAGHAAAPEPAAPDAASPGLIVYTSGTTGQPKGAIITHANLVADGTAAMRWMGMAPGVPILGLAPLFHITGACCHLMAGMAAPAPVVLLHRFEAGLALDAAQEHRPRATIAAVTAFIAMMNHPRAAPAQLDSLTHIFSGGAPVPAEVAVRFERQFGRRLHNGYGLTETSSLSHGVPLGREGRVDPDSGSLSIGLPVYGMRCWIMAEDGSPAPVGETGEIVTLGPTVSPGYWNKPAETAVAMRADGLRTGDVGFMDADGWFYLVDRKKDMIVASGFKVWPREVEDVLYAHPAVREAAVVGVADPYRGETVKAVVSLRPGQVADPAELVAHCRARMAAYKVPRVVEVIDELPKTMTGKILRRSLR